MAYTDQPITLQTSKFISRVKWYKFQAPSTFGSKVVSYHSGVSVERPPSSRRPAVLIRPRRGRTSLNRAKAFNLNASCIAHISSIQCRGCIDRSMGLGMQASHAVGNRTVFAASQGNTRNVIMTANTSLNGANFDTSIPDVYLAITTADNAHFPRCNKGTQKVSVLSF